MTHDQSCSLINEAAYDSTVFFFGINIYIVISIINCVHDYSVCVINITESYILHKEPHKGFSVLG